MTFNPKKTRERIEAADANDTAMTSACGEYNCDCHREMPAALAFIHNLETNADPAGMVRANVMLRDENAQLRAKIAKIIQERTALRRACESWINYFNQLEAHSMPGDTLTRIRREFHGRRLAETRAALDLGETL